MPKPDNSHSKKITEAIPEYFFIYDIKREGITYISDSFQKFRLDKPTGTDLEQMRNMMHANFHAIFDKVFEDVNNGIYVQDKDMRINSADDGESWVNVKTYPIISDDKQLIAGHVLNISAKVQQLHGLKKETDELEQIIQIMAHDLRGPIGSILNISEIQGDAIREKDYNNAEIYAAMTERIAREMSNTLKAMIEMIELKSDRFQLNKSRTNIKEFLITIAGNFAIDMENKEIEFHTNLPDNEIYAELDQLKFKLVVQNLINNAIKFTEQGGKVTLTLFQEKNDIVIEISDTGIGISEDKVVQIFDKFTRMKRAGTKGEKSTGLGLSIAKKITEMHHGSINVRSNEGEGTTFSIILPMIIKSKERLRKHKK